MNAWKKGSGVDQKSAEAAARGATKAPEYATKIWKAMKGAVGKTTEAASSKNDMSKPEAKRKSTY